MLDIRLRRAAPDEGAVLFTLMRRLFRETYSARFGGLCRDADVESYVADHFSEVQQSAELLDPACRTYFAEVDGVIGGFAQLRDGAPPEMRAAGVDGNAPVEVARFYVDAPWHGRGVASRLMRHCVDEAASADPLWLGVFEHNRRARAFYAKWGFVQVGRSRFQLGEDMQLDWILARPSP